ncbi:hypothetical protein EPO04_02005 [Patescibacteria group bacterium]|nr:MAG: hypothetical protein EPO04_02005 [Patescibacteria group bacterium]
MLSSLFKAIKRQLRPTPSLREAHRRYQLHLRADGSCDFVAAGLTYIECVALEWVLKCSPNADGRVYDPSTARATWWANHQAMIDCSIEDQSFCHRVIGLLERWERQEEAAKYRLNMPPGVGLPYGSVVDNTWF